MLEAVLAFFTDTVLGEFWPWLAGGVASLLAIAGAYLKGRRDQHGADELERAYDYQETRERMDEIRADDDVDAARERLRNRQS